MNQDDTKDIPAENVRQTPKKKEEGQDDRDFMLLPIATPDPIVPVLNPKPGPVSVPNSVVAPTAVSMASPFLESISIPNKETTAASPFKTQAQDLQLPEDKKDNSSNEMQLTSKKNKDCKFRKKTFGWT